jgi:serine/threonine-protein kinase
MNEPNGKLNRLVRPEPTQDYQGTAAPSRPAEERGQVALVTSSGPCLNTELRCLLRRRLRVAALLLTFGLVGFLIRGFFVVGACSPTAFDRSLQVTVTVISAVLAGLLWTRWQLCLAQLRVIEVALFGSVAALFLWYQYRYVDSGMVLQLLPDGSPGRPGGPPATSEDLARIGTLFRVAESTNATRWLVLIVIYGTCIPNTWRRCATVTGILALVPFLLCLGFGLRPESALHPYLGEVLPDMALILCLGVATAVFGSYKFSTLRNEAYHARKLGQYRLKEKLGSGGMGEVYLAEHVLLRRPCAIKLIRPDLTRDGTSLKRFEREVRATATLTHWNTVEIFDYGRAADGTFYYVMEYLPGLSLQELVDRYGPMLPERAVYLLRQVCRGLREAHSIGLIHRDIKPSNILACERGGQQDVAKLLDFGLVRCAKATKEAARLTQEGVVAGSPMYMSPEQVKGKDDLDARSDIYNLGLVAYFLLTGQPPFERESPMEALMAHVYEAVPAFEQFRPGVPPDLQEIVRSCLEKDPAHRFQNVAALEKALSQCACVNAWDEEKAAAWWGEQKTYGTLPPQPESTVAALSSTA